MSRIVSLLPSSTEIISALGCGDQLVGRSHECDFPAGIDGLPACTAPKFDPDGTSYEIDQRVKAVLQEALSVYRVDADLLDQLAPDLIVTQSQCEVCAVDLAEVERAACRMVRSRPRLLSLESDNLAGVWTNVETVAAALQVPEYGRELTDTYSARLATLAAGRGALSMRPTVACIEWFDPLMAAGNWVPELVEIAGGDNRFGEVGRHSPWMKWEELVADDPEVIVLMPCGFGLERTLREAAALVRHPSWKELRAVAEGRVFAADGNQYFNRPGPRLVESAEILAEILHPESFDFGHEGSAWSRL